MTDKGAIKLVHKVLKDKDRWYIEPFAGEGAEDPCEKAKEYADYQLPKLSMFALYQRYNVWKKSDPFMKPCDHLFHEFVNQVAFDLGKKALKGRDLLLYEENCNLTVKYIS